MSIAVAALVAAGATQACSDAAPAAEADDGGANADASTVGDAGGGPDAIAPRATLRVLFIGNSYTYVHDVPAILARIAATAPEGPLVETDQVVVGAQTLQGHLDDGVAPAKIAEARWSHVVLQQQSLAAAGGTAGLGTGAKELGELVASAGARPVWYVTWARAAGDSEYGRNFVGPDHMQDFITRANDEEARRRPGSLLACVGEAFRTSLRESPGITLHQSDLSHATLAGAYLAASTFYVALTGRPVPPEAEVPVGLTAEDAAALRRAALVGSSCGGLTLRPSLTILDGVSGFDLGAFGNAPFDFGAAGTPVSATFFLRNRGELPAPTTFRFDGPFTWTGGVFPGNSAPVAGTPPCESTLAPGSTCQVAITYQGEPVDGGAVVLASAQAYQSEIREPLEGARAFVDRAHLTLAAMTGLCASTQPKSCGVMSRTSEWLFEEGAEPVVTLVLANRGGAAATNILGRALPAPFAWNGGAFPGGRGTGLSTRTLPRDLHPPRALPFCGQTLAPGEQCVVALRAEAPDGGDPSGVIGVDYEDAIGPSPEGASLRILVFPPPPADAGADAN